MKIPQFTNLPAFLKGVIFFYLWTWNRKHWHYFHVFVIILRVFWHFWSMSLLRIFTQKTFGAQENSLHMHMSWHILGPIKPLRYQPAGRWPSHLHRAPLRLRQVNLRSQHFLFLIILRFSPTNLANIESKTCKVNSLSKSFKGYQKNLTS